MYVRKKDLEKEDGTYDSTPGCEGCDALMIGLPAVAHNQHSRMKLENKLKETEEGQKRLADVERRMEEGKTKKGRAALEQAGFPDPLEGEVRSPVALGQPEEDQGRPKRGQEG